MHIQVPSLHHDHYIIQYFQNHIHPLKKGNGSHETTNGTKTGSGSLSGAGVAGMSAGSRAAGSALNAANGRGHGGAVGTSDSSGSSGTGTSGDYGGSGSAATGGGGGSDGRAGGLGREVRSTVVLAELFQGDVRSLI